MPKAKQFGETEKTNVMLWFDEGVMSKEIAERLGRKKEHIWKIIWIHKGLLLLATPLLLKKHSGCKRKQFSCKTRGCVATSFAIHSKLLRS
jgi:hypothetical protein